MSFGFIFLLTSSNHFDVALNTLNHYSVTSTISVFLKRNMSYNYFQFRFFARLLPHSFDVTPVGQSSQRSLLLTHSTVHRQQLTSCVYKHFCIANRFIYAPESTNFASHGNREVLVQSAHCEYDEKYNMYM